MVRRILAYALTLLCGGAFYLFYPGYLSFYTLSLLLVLPLLSLAFTLLARRRRRLDIAVRQGIVRRGEEAFARLSLRGPAGDILKFTFRLENLLYPEAGKVETVTLTAGQVKTLTLPTGHCGWVKLTPLRCALPGWLGCISLPLSLPQPLLALVTPQPGQLPQGLDLSPQTGVRLQPRPGGGPGEEYELRPYRPGDPVNAIHWKLTAKQPGEEPILRETLEPVQTRLVVTYDHFGPAEALDDALDQLLGLEEYLLAHEQPFTLCWASPVQETMTYYDIDCPMAWERCYRAIAAQQAPQTGFGAANVLSIPGWTGPIKRIHLTGHQGEVKEP